MWVRGIYVLLEVVGRGCVRRGSLRRLPALKTSVVVFRWFGVVERLSCLKCLERGSDEKDM